MAAKALVVLNVASNQLTQLPDELVHAWQAMKELDVSGNQLQVCMSTPLHRSCYATALA